MPYVVFAFFGFVVGFTWPSWAATFVFLGALVSATVALWVDVSTGKPLNFFRAYAEALVYRAYLPAAGGLLVGSVYAVCR